MPLGLSYCVLRIWRIFQGWSIYRGQDALEFMCLAPQDYYIGFLRSLKAWESSRLGQSHIALVEAQSLRAPAGGDAISRSQYR